MLCNLKIGEISCYSEIALILSRSLVSESCCSSSFNDHMESRMLWLLSNASDFVTQNEFVHLLKKSNIS